MPPKPDTKHVSQTLSEFDDWTSRQDIAEHLGRPNQRLTMSDLTDIDSLVESGEVAKRIQPSEAPQVVYEYKSLKKRRSRKEVVYNILREYYAGQWATIEEIAGALTSASTALSSDDKRWLLELIEEGKVEERYDKVRKTTTYRSNSSRKSARNNAP